MITKYYTIFIVLSMVSSSQLVTGNREHKVHGIVLYPDKHSWCTTLPIKQVISAETDGCKSIEIDNNVCVGACFSYSIPRTEPSDPGEVIIPYCDSCQPFETKWENVTLSCQHSQPDYEQSQIIVKRVQIITNCSCSSCGDNPTNNGAKASHSSHLLADNSDQLLAAQKNDLPDLLKDVLHSHENDQDHNSGFQQPSGNNNNNDDYQVDASIEDTNDVQQQQFANEIPQFHPTNDHQVRTENIKAMLNNRLITLLKNIQEKNSQYDKKELVELLKIIQGPDQNLSDKNIVDFVESLNSEHIELDIPRLKEILMKVEHEKHHQNHHPHQHHHQHDHQHGHGHHNQHHRDHQDHHQGHDDHEASHELELLPEKDGHLQSTYIGMGHLKKGPHNALVIEPDEKPQQLIDVNSNDLKPNHAGTLLSYQHHHQSQK